MVNRTCIDCGTDISGMHGKCIRCPDCRDKKYPPSKYVCRYRCGRAVFSAGLCKSCYQFDLQYGEGYALLTPEERFWREVNKDGPVTDEGLGPCWIWTGGRSAGGLGTLPLEGGWTYAHRFAYELLSGPIPGKRKIIQVCEVITCVNPDHLRAIAGVSHTARPLPVLAEGVADTDLAYWGGLIDGEGHFGIHEGLNAAGVAVSYQSRFSLRMTDRPLVAMFADTFGLEVDPRIYHNQFSVLPLYETATYSAHAAGLATLLLPWLRLKTSQAELLIRLETEKQQPGLRTQPGATHLRNMSDGRVIQRRASRYAQEHLDRWHGYHLAVRRLNRPGREAA